MFAKIVVSLAVALVALITFAGCARVFVDDTTCGCGGSGGSSTSSSSSGAGPLACPKEGPCLNLYPGEVCFQNSPPNHIYGVCDEGCGCNITDHCEVANCPWHECQAATCADGQCALMSEQDGAPCSNGRTCEGGKCLCASGCFDPLLGVCADSCSAGSECSADGQCAAFAFDPCQPETLTCASTKPCDYEGECCAYGPNGCASICATCCGSFPDGFALRCRDL